MTEDKVMPDIEEDQDNIDGCDIAFHKAKATPDEELPVAVGGVELEEEGEDIDGCDVDFNASDATPDDELPAAEGGIV